MSLSEELDRLDGLRQRGVLNEEEFTRAKTRLLETSAWQAANTGTHTNTHTSPVPVLAALNGFRRSRSDRWLGGVCGGLAQVTGLESWVWRLMLALLVLFGGVGLLIYVLMWIFVPSE